MSSHAPRPAPAELLAALGSALHPHGLRWYVFGAQAVVAYGRPRMTADVDVTVDLRGSSTLELVRILCDSGFQSRFELGDAFLAEAQLLPMLHVSTAMPVDLVALQPGLQEDFLARVRAVDVGGVMAPMISPEDLIAMKVLAARRKDLEDVRGVLMERWETLDFEQIAAVVARLDEALGGDTLRQRLARLTRQVKKRLDELP